MFLRFLAFFYAILAMPLMGAEKSSLEFIATLASAKLLGRFLTPSDLNNLQAVSLALHSTTTSYLKQPHEHSWAIHSPKLMPAWGFLANPRYSLTLAAHSPRIDENILLKLVSGLLTQHPSASDIVLMRRLLPFQKRITLALAKAQFYHVKAFRDEILASEDGKKDLTHFFLTFFNFDLLVYHRGIVDMAVDAAGAWGGEEAGAATEDLIPESNLDSQEAGDLIYAGFIEDFSSEIRSDELTANMKKDLEPIMTIYLQALCDGDQSDIVVAETALTIARILGPAWMLQNGDPLRRILFEKVKSYEEAIQGSDFDLKCLIEWLSKNHPAIERDDLVTMILLIFPYELVRNWEI